MFTSAHKMPSDLMVAFTYISKYLLDYLLSALQCFKIAIIHKGLIPSFFQFFVPSFLADNY